MHFFRAIQNRRLIGAHRGYRSIRPENTLSAFTASLGHCHFIELDVQMSRDGVAVIHHDDELGRTSNGKELAVQIGKNSLRLDRWDLAELQQLDVGSWFLAADPFGRLESEELQPDVIQDHLPQKIMTLGELLEWVNKVQIPVNIEIKDQSSRTHDGTIVDTVLGAVHEAGCSSTILISSFRHDYLRQVKKQMPDIPIGALKGGRHPDNLLAYLSDLGADAYHPDVEITSEQLIRQLRQNGFGVNIYTVNDKNTQRRLFAAGATAVITDFPDLTVAW